MRPISVTCISVLSVLLLLLTLLIFIVNQYTYQYQGNNYFPSDFPLLVLSVVITNIGLRLYFPKNSKPCLMGEQVLYFVVVLTLIAFATNAIQLTPFAPIDHYIIQIESKVGVNLAPLMEWANHYPKLINNLKFIYDTLPYQLSLLPFLLIFTCRFYLLQEYYFMLLCTAIIGFIFYYFFPTTAPASMIHSPFFFKEQFDTGLKFNEIHHYITPSTYKGGLISMPSFHVIWAVLCVAMLRDWPILCTCLALVNLLLIAACVLLGWHYCSDIIGSIFVLLLSYYLLSLCHNKTEN